MSAVPPAAAQAFRQAPQGFFAANDTLNTFTPALFTNMVLDLLQSTATQSGAVPPATYVESSGLSSAEVSSCIQALSFIFRILVQQQLSGEQTAALLQKETDLSDEKRQTLAQLWTDYNKSETASKLSAVSRTLSLGRLVNLSWRVGVGISSSQCEALAAPFVTLAFEVAQQQPAAAPAQTQGALGAADQLTAASGSNTHTHIVECTHHEFQEVRKHFYDIFAQLDTI